MVLWRDPARRPRVIGVPFHGWQLAGAGLLGTVAWRGHSLTFNASEVQGARSELVDPGMDSRW